MVLRPGPGTLSKGNMARIGCYSPFLTGTSYILSQYCSVLFTAGPCSTLHKFFCVSEG